MGLSSDSRVMIGALSQSVFPTRHLVASRDQSSKEAIYHS